MHVKNKTSLVWLKDCWHQPQTQNTSKAPSRNPVVQELRWCEDGNMPGLQERVS